MHFGFLSMVLLVYNTAFISVVKTGFLTSPRFFLVQIRADNKRLCVGSYTLIISGYHVITVASCVEELELKQMQVVMMSETGHHMFRSVLKRRIHPSYEKDKRTYNIALLMLNEEFQDNIRAKLILAVPRFKFKECYLHTLTDNTNIQSIKVQSLDLQECKKIYSQQNLTDLVKDTFLCAQYPQNRCNQEFGFILVCNPVQLTGVGLDGTTSCGLTKPYLFYDISKFRDWIQFTFSRLSTQAKSGTEYQTVNICLTLIFMLLLITNY